MVVKVIYNNLSQDYAAEISICVLALSEDNKVELYNEGFYKDKKKAILIKASCGTKLSPMVAVYNNEKELIKVFYKEDNSNELSNVKKWLNAQSEKTN